MRKQQQALNALTSIMLLLKISSRIAVKKIENIKNKALAVEDVIDSNATLQLVYARRKPALALPTFTMLILVLNKTAILALTPSAFKSKLNTNRKDIN